MSAKWKLHIKQTRFHANEIKFYLHVCRFITASNYNKRRNYELQRYSVFYRELQRTHQWYRICLLCSLWEALHCLPANKNVKFLKCSKVNLKYSVGYIKFNENVMVNIWYFQKALFTKLLYILLSELNNCVNLTQGFFDWLFFVL